MRHQLTLSALAFCAASLPAAATAQVEAGQLFAEHCAYCHGADATGGGPLAPSLVLQPKT
jgi:Cytochrome c553